MKLTRDLIMNRWVLSNIFLAAAAWITLIIPIAADEGMHPISGIKSLNLKSKGLVMVTLG